MIYMSWLRQKTQLEKLLMVPNTVRRGEVQGAGGGCSWDTSRGEGGALGQAEVSAKR